MPTARKPAVKDVSDTPRLYKVFVSSTYLDNKKRRKLVQDAITMAGMVWHGMEIFPASTEPTVDECLRYAREADVLVGIIAWRYGWIPENRDKSITELEYNAAKKRLMFLLNPELPFSEKDFDPGPERWDKQNKLEGFKIRFSRDQMPTLFEENTLQAKVFQALQEWRKGKEPSPQSNSINSEVPLGPAVDDSLAEEIRGYCDKADALHATLPVAGFVTQLKVPIDIEDIYVPLRGMVDLRGVGEDCFADSSHAEKILRECDATVEISLPEAFLQPAKRRRRGVVVLGDPGAGKDHLPQTAPAVVPAQRA